MDQGPVVYIDVEHEQVLRDPDRADAHAASTEEARRRLAEAAGKPCVTVRYTEVLPHVLAELGPSAVVISGCFSAWEDYDFSAFDGLFAVIRSVAVPLLGICGGFQLLGFAHGARLGPIGPLQPGEEDPDASFAPGLRKERGFLGVDVDPECVMFRGLASRPRFFQSHYWEMKEAPVGFVVRASSDVSAIQAIEARGRPVFGVEFHPERFDETHPDGGVLLRNFLSG
jgi:GMP synthase (glutamine-hydrolysing)